VNDAAAIGCFRGTHTSDTCVCAVCDVVEMGSGSCRRISTTPNLNPTPQIPWIYILSVSPPLLAVFLLCPPFGSPGHCSLLPVESPPQSPWYHRSVAHVSPWCALQVRPLAERLLADCTIDSDGCRFRSRCPLLSVCLFGSRYFSPLASPNSVFRMFTILPR